MGAADWPGEDRAHTSHQNATRGTNLEPSMQDVRGEDGAREWLVFGVHCVWEESGHGDAD